jgi:hypothetical protein
VCLFLLSIPLSAKLFLDGGGELPDGVEFVLDSVLLLDEEEVALEDVEEEREVGEGLADAVVGQLGAALEDLVDAVGVSLDQERITRGLVKRKQQLSRILHCSFFLMILEHRDTMLVTSVS